MVASGGMEIKIVPQRLLIAPSGAILCHPDPLKARRT
jgi:hypothetical protein